MSDDERGETVISGSEALQRLRDGNLRFKSGQRSHDAHTSPAHRNRLVEGQHPFAVILGCSDSRVPVELVFDQGLGDLFVIRIAGNIVTPSQIGSVEFAADRFGTGLVVILGHTHCGAVEATLEQLTVSAETQSRNLRTIVDSIRPAIEPLLARDPDADPATLARDAVRANVRASVEALQQGSEILKQLIEQGRLLIVGAEYALETGVVDFFDGVPETG